MSIHGGEHSYSESEGKPSTTAVREVERDHQDRDRSGRGRAE